MKDAIKFIASVIICVALVWAVANIPPKPAPVDPQVQQLQEQVNQLQTRLDEVESVQGYMAWKQDWRSK